MSSLLLAIALTQAAKPALPAAEGTKFRVAFAEALADPDAKRSKLVGLAKTLEAKYALDSLLDALREGPKLPSGDPKPRKVGKDKEKLQQIGDVTVGFLFESGKDTFGYLVAVPKKYDPAKPAPVVLDPGHGTGASKTPAEKADFTPYFRNSADSAGLGDALVVRTEIIEQIGADGLKGARPEDEVAAVFDDMFRDLASRFALDLDRIYVGGISQTGFWSWYLGRARPDRFAGIAPIAAVTWQVDRYLDCYRNLPVYVVHGENDPICKVAMPRKTTKLLEDLGFPVTYVEIAGGEHGGPVFGRMSEALGALAKQPRDAWPKHVSRSFATTHAPHAYWIEALKLEKEGDGKAGSAPVATIDAVVAGQTVTITSKGIAGIRLSLGAELLDVEQPVDVVWNGKEVHAGKLETSFESAVERALDKVDWRAVGPAQLTLNAPR